MLKLHPSHIAYLLLSSLFLAMPAHAIQGELTSTIRRILNTGDHTYGGCMVELDAHINTATNSPNCPNRWVSFSCTGEFTEKDYAFQMLDTASLAFSLNKSVKVYVDDAKKQNGSCFAYRLDVLR